MLVEEELSRAVPEKDTALTIGVFDGVHLGHRFLIEKLNEKAASEGLMSGVITFKQHPRLVFSPSSQITFLTTLDERIRLLESLGVAHVVTLSFTPELSRLSAREFVTLLKRHLRMRGLVIGPDFALGSGREGDARALKALGEELDFSVEMVPPRLLQGKVVSSTAIRGALSQGNVKEVGELLGRCFTLTGQVSHGDARGKSLGFPTANLIPKREQALPADGVYAAHVFFSEPNIGVRPAIRGRARKTARKADSEKAYQAVINIGLRPTFDGSKRIVEAHLLDFAGDIYGHTLKIELVERLRGEEKFSGAQELKAQMARDVEQARSLLKRP
jgi:riboflavin kinase/FMN adenylyltransferase